MIYYAARQADFGRCRREHFPGTLIHARVRRYAGGAPGEQCPLRMAIRSSLFITNNT